jgi:hypothetical protein
MRRKALKKLRYNLQAQYSEPISLLHEHQPSR